MDGSDKPPQKEPPLVIGHPDLASGASVQSGGNLYVSVMEAIYREGLGERVEIHLHPTEEDNAALEGMRTRTRKRWGDDRLPDGWTQYVPPKPSPKAPPKRKPRSKKTPGQLPDDLRRLAESIQAKQGDNQSQ